MKRIIPILVLCLFMINQSLLVHAATNPPKGNSCILTEYQIELPEATNYLNLNTYQERYESLQEDIRLEEERKAEEKRLAILRAYQINYNNAWSVANSLVGYRGDCWYIANLFSQRFRGYSISSKYQISYEEAIPGDLIYYANGGLNYEHWATYLGNNLSLQGNYNGIAIIHSIYLTGATSPVFYRVS